LDVRKIIEEIVYRHERPICCCAQKIVATMFEFARKQRNAHIDCFLQVWLQSWQHREAARHMEAANGHRNTRVAERSREIEGTWVLVGLHSSEYDKPEITVPAESPYDLAR
jgi:hypothetical protein